MTRTAVSTVSRSPEAKIGGMTRSLAIWKWLGVAVPVAALFLMRPAALGQSFTSLSLIVVGLATAIIALHRSMRANPTSFRLDLNLSIAILVLCVYWAYLTVLVIVFERTDVELFAKELVTTAIVGGGYAYLFNCSDYRRRFFRAFSTVMALIGWSGAITILLAVMLGGVERLHLGNLPVKGYSANASLTLDPAFKTGAVYFPFSMLYGKFTSGGVVLHRLNGFFREPGIFQAVALFCFVSEFFGRRSVIRLVGLILGVIMTFSTIAILLGLVTVGLAFAIERGLRLKSVLLSVLAVSSGVVGLFAVPYIGVIDKVKTHTASWEDRASAVERNLVRFSENPFGTGHFSGVQFGDGISLLAQISQIGLIGFACHLILLSGFKWQTTSRRVDLLAFFPIWVTAVFLQPLAGAPMIYVLMFHPGLERTLIGHFQSKGPSGKKR
jgi:hypothetical protein